MASNDGSVFNKKRERKGRKEDCIKKLKVEGKEHTNHVEKCVAAKQIGDDCR